MRMIESNKGPMVGGPFDGKEHSTLLYPPDWPDPAPLAPTERTDVCRLFSKNFPEGAIYHWNEDSKEWHYQGPFEEGESSARDFLDAFGVEPEPPL